MKRAMGALLAFATTANAQPAEPPEHTADVEIAGPVLMVTDLERSLKFYAEGLGFAVGARLPGNPGPGVTVTARPGSLAPFLLLRQQEPDAAKSTPIEQGNGFSRIMLVAADSQVVAARLDAAGYAHTPVNEHKVFFVSDPDGYRLEVLQRSSRH
jgi:lactoylglutathione lyase